MLSLNTFGKTPAAEHLVRKLNEIADEKVRASYIRSIGIAIKNCNNNLRGIREAAHSYYMPVKVAANLLRLLREEANNINVCGDKHISDLTRNVVIGNIKRVIREVTVLRKIESVTTSVHKIKTKCLVEDVTDDYTTYSYMGYEIGHMSYGEFEPFAYPIVHDHVTHELLHKRSQRRRAGKVEA
jgi:hypothetical protein